MARMPTEFTFTASTGTKYLPYLRRHLPAASALIKHAPADVSVAIVGDRTMSRLHEQFMSLPTPTDVLTFELEFDRHGRVSEGEIVICLPVARRQTTIVPPARRESAVRAELLLYALHGLLHLCGWTDEHDKDFTAMHKYEDQLLTRIGVGRIFATGERS